MLQFSLFLMNRLKSSLKCFFFVFFFGFVLYFQKGPYFGIFCNCSMYLKPLKRRQSRQLSYALSSAGYFKSHCCKQCGPRSDCSFRSSLIWVHTVFYAKCKFEKFARRCSRRHKQTTFSDADFLGTLRVKCLCGSSKLLPLT